MAREGKSESDQFDIDGLRQLMELMEQHDVREVKLQRGEVRYVLRRGPQEVYAAMPVASAAPVSAAHAAAAPSAGDVPAAASVADENLIQIKSPTVGTFYQSPAPGEGAFVKIGDQVGADTIVCIVEAMKVFNQIPAGVSGTIVRILVTDGDAVEFGQPLFLVKSA